MFMDSGIMVIVAIVETGRGGPLVRAARAAGACGATVLHGRGTAPRGTRRRTASRSGGRGKDVVLMLVSRVSARRILEAINTCERLDEPGAGLAFAAPVALLSGSASGMTDRQVTRLFAWFKDRRARTPFTPWDILTQAEEPAVEEEPEAEPVTRGKPRRARCRSGSRKKPRAGPAGKST